MTKNENDKPEENPGAALLKNVYKAGMGAAETMHRTAIDIPLTILEQLGIEEDKIKALRTKSSDLINELYRAIDTVASKSGIVGGERSGEGDTPAKDKDTGK